MHIKRLLSGSLAALMVASSFNVPVVRAAEDEPTEVVEEAKVDTSGDDDVIVDDVPEVETEKTTEVSEPEETPVVEEPAVEAASEETTPEVVVEEAGEQEVVGAETDINVAITFDTKDGGTATGGSSTVTKAADATSIEVTLPTGGVEKTGYTLTGWTTEENGTTPLEVTNENKVEIGVEANAETATLYAIWAENQVTVTYDGNNAATGSTGSTVAKYTGSTKFASNGFTAPEGKEFAGWAENKSEADPEKIYTDVAPIPTAWMTSDAAEKTVYAIWKDAETQLPKQIIHFNSNKPTGTKVVGTMEDQQIDSKTSEDLTANKFKIDGYKFEGWTKVTPIDGNLNAPAPILGQGETVDFADKASYTVEELTYDEDAYLYARWSVEQATNAKITLTLDANGGKNTDGSDSTTVIQEVNKGQSTAIKFSQPFYRNGYKLAGWSDTEDGSKKYNVTGRVVLNEDTTLYAVWEDGASFDNGLYIDGLADEDKVDWKGNDTSVAPDIKVYMDETKKTVVDDSVLTFKWEAYKGTTKTISAAKADKDAADKWEVAEDNVKAKGVYRVTISVGNEPGIKESSKTLYFEVGTPTPSAANITLSASVTALATDKADTFYLTYVATASTDVKKGDPVAVEPNVAVKDLGTLEKGTDYTITYSSNKALGTGKVVVKWLKDNAEYGIQKDKTIEKTFTIADKPYTQADLVDPEITNAVVDTTDSKCKAGKKVYTLSGTNKVVEVAIPKIDKSKTVLVGSYREADFENGNSNAPKINGIFDANGKELNIKVTEYKYDVNADGKGVATVTLPTNDEYEGSFEVTPITFKDCDRHEYEKKITPGTTEAEGKVEEVCKNCGSVKADSTKRIEKLESVSFKIGDTTYVNSDTKVNFLGKPITINDITVNSENAIPSNEYSSDTYKSDAINTYSDFDENDEYTDYFTVSYKDKNGKETNTGVGTCTVTITFTDKIPEYAGSSITKTFKIEETAEKPVAPVIKNYEDDASTGNSYTYNNRHYGDELVIESDTEGAKVFWLLAEEGVTGILDEGKLVADATEYKNPVKLVDTMYSVTSGTVEQGRKDQIVIYAVAQKNGVLSDPSTFTLNLFNARDDWGEVINQVDGDFADAREIPEGIWISDKTIGTLDDHSQRGTTYTGLPKVLPTKYTRDGATIDPTKSYRVFFHNELLTCGTDYTVSYKNNINAWTYEGVEEGIYNATKAPTITITGKGQYAGSFSQTFEIQPVDISTIAITPNENGYNPSPATLVPDVTLAETAKAQTPKFAAKYNYYLYNTNYTGGSYKTLTLGAKDITADYRDVQAAANTTAKPLYEVKLTGTGNYTGTVSRYVKVVPTGLLLNKATVSFDTSEVNFNGKDQLGNVKATVKIGTIELAQDKDFELSCEYLGVPKANYKTDYGYNHSYNYYGHNDELYTAGKYIITVKAKAGSNYSGEVSKTVTINKKGELAIKSVDVTLPSKVPALTEVYDGMYASVFDDGTVDVRDGGNILEEGKDYLLLYKNNLKAGKAKVQVVGIGKYSGTKDVAYTIDATKLTEANIQYKPNATSVVYKGSDYYKGYTVNNGNVTYNHDDLFSIVVTEDNQPKTLVEDEDYVVVDAKDSKNVGKKTIKITGINNYKGTVNAKFEITKFDISGLKGTSAYGTTDPYINLAVDSKDNIPSVSYTGMAYQPYTVNVPLDRDSWTSEAAYKNWYKQNFTFSYKNGFKAGSTVTVKVTGKKNFTGSVTGTYTVGKADINNTDTTITDVSANKKFVAPTLNVFVKGTTKKLARETRAKWTTTTKDYTVEYLYNATTANHKRYDAVNTKEAMVAGTEYIARINGVGSYEGYKDVVFRVVDKSQDISKATIKVNGTYIFRDQPIMLDKDDISVSIGGKAVPSENFEIVGYTNNNKVGTAKVKIHGVVTDDKNKYGGYKEATFKIQKLSMNYILQFKADKISTDNKTLTIGGNMANKTQKDNAVFVLPKNSFTASVGTGKDKVSYVLSYYFDAAGNKYQPGDVYDAETDPSVVATLTAKFEPAKDGATLTFKGGEGATGTAPKDIKTKRGIVSKLPGKGSLKKDNFVFVGWTNDNGHTVLKAGATVCNIENGKNTFTAVWAEAPYKIAYNYNGGNAPATANPATYTKADANKEIVVNAPTRSGYQFAGWTDGTKDQAPVAKYKVPADKVGKTIKLKANWTPNTFTLAFDANGVALATGTTLPTAMANQKVGEAIKLPEALTTTDKQIVKFEGWAKDKNSAKPDYKAKATVKDILAENNSQVVLYAVWTPVQYKITWDMNGGTSQKAGAKVYTAKTASSITTEAGFPAAPTRAKRTFGGWKINGEGTAVTSLASLAADPKDVTLVADWGENDNTATKKITYNTGDAGIVMAAKEVVVPDTVTLDTLDASKATSKTSDKFVFSGWDSNSDGKVDYGNGAEIEMNDADVTLTAVWKEKSYAIHYNTNGATFKSDADINRTFKATVGASLPTGDDMDYAGHTFGGWFEKSDLSGTAVNSVPTDAVADVTYYAKWTGNKMTIKYDKGDATFNEGVTKIDDQVYQISPDKDVTNPTALANAEFTKKGYTFKGWTIKDATVKAETLDTLVAKLTAGTIADNATVTLVPIWEANTYSVVYNYDGGKLSDADAKVQPSEFTVGVTENTENKIYTTLQTPVQRGKVFGGWYVVESSSAAIPEKDPVSISTLENASAIPASGSTLYLRAKWTDAKKVTITFKAGSETGAATATQVIYAGEKLALTANTFTKSGFTFKAWSSSDGGTLEDKEIYDATSLTADKALVLTATWNVIETTINYNANGGTGAPLPKAFTAQQANDTKIATIGSMAKANYTFKEWNTKRNGSGTAYAPDSSAAALAPTTYSKEITLYAIWTENDYALVTFDTNGGSDLETTFENPKKYYTAGATITTPTTDPTRAGYRFKGWKVGTGHVPATITADDIKAKKSIVVKADWTEVTYSIAWAGIDEDKNPNKSKTTWKASEGEVTLQAPTTVDGKTFTEWTWKVEGGTDATLAGGKLNTTNINVTTADTVKIIITANWE